MPNLYSWIWVWAEPKSATQPWGARKEAGEQEDWLKRLEYLEILELYEVGNWKKSLPVRSCGPQPSGRTLGLSAPGMNGFFHTRPYQSAFQQWSPETQISTRLLVGSIMQTPV